jgi:hypothetical protein
MSSFHSDYFFACNTQFFILRHIYLYFILARFEGGTLHCQFNKTPFNDTGTRATTESTNNWNNTVEDVLKANAFQQSVMALAPIAFHNMVSNFPSF